LTGKKHKKNLERTPTLTHENKETYKDIYLTEMAIRELSVNLLVEQIDNTKINLEKKLSRTRDELEADRELEEAEEAVVGPSVVQEDSDEEEPEIKMTIDKYPIGWDGKPIPYWLYKLHGLGVEYRCEICGNNSYWGRKAYEQHFQEWRHAHGMRCLGIPNTRHFHDITKINDALQLWDKIRKDQTEIVWKSTVEEEFEDKDGNVYSKKVYDDLRRQGLI